MLLGALFLACCMASIVVALPNERKLECLAEGRFPHPGDCGSFIDCTPDLDGGFYLKTRSCLGLAYHPTHKKCVDLGKVKGCIPRTPKSLQSDPKLNHVCEGIDLDFVCADCVTLVNCINGTAYPEPCDHGNLCAIKDSFAGGVCYPQDPLECTCDKPNVFHKDYYSHSSFYFCEEVGSQPEVHACPEGMIFDDEKRQCVNTNGLPPCNNIGVFANEYDCTQYYTCIFATDGWVQKKFRCNETGEHLMYNEATGQCEDPCNWKADEFQCRSEGRYADPLDCTKYYECIIDPSELPKPDETTLPAVDTKPVVLPAEIINPSENTKPATNPSIKPVVLPAEIINPSESTKPATKPASKPAVLPIDLDEIQRYGGVKYIVTHHECPEGFVWNQTVKNGFGHCVPITSDTKACNPIVANKCSVPPQWCEV